MREADDLRGDVCCIYTRLTLYSTLYIYLRGQHKHQQYSTAQQGTA